MWEGGKMWKRANEFRKSIFKKTYCFFVMQIIECKVQNYLLVERLHRK